MREHKIIVEPFELLDVLSCRGKIGEDSHGYMGISIQAKKWNIKGFFQQSFGLILKHMMRMALRSHCSQAL